MSDFSNVAITLVLALTASVLLVPISMIAGVRSGFVSKPRLFGSCERRIPNIGGLAIAIAGAFAFFSVHGPSGGMGVVALGGLLAIGLGLADDKVIALQPLVHHRLALQVVIALAAWAGGLRADEPGFLGLTATVLVLVASMNSFNLLDNMDGVAGSTGAAAGAGIAILAALNGQFLVASLAAAIAGACIGFLPYNIRQARVYLGNGGSLLLGFLLGGAALKLRLPLEQPWSVLTTITLLGIPATDTAVAMISRLRNHRGIMTGGVDHISHRLVKLGLNPLEAALAHGATTLLAAAMGAFVVIYGNPQLLLVPLGLLAFLGLGLLRVDVYEVQEAEEVTIGFSLVANDSQDASDSSNLTGIADVPRVGGTTASALAAPEA